MRKAHRVIVSDRTKVIQPLEASQKLPVLALCAPGGWGAMGSAPCPPPALRAPPLTTHNPLPPSHPEAVAKPGEGITLREASSITSAIPTKPANALQMDAATVALLQSEWQDSQAKLAKFDAETSRRQAEITTVQQTIASKATQRERQTQLTAPVDGVIQQLVIHSVGGVVTTAQPLMIVVPDSTEVTAEVSIANQDIGFVNAGQAAEVKLETFPYTQYGTVAATVDVVSADAVTDERKGADGKAAQSAVYPATLTLHQKDMLVDGKRVNLSPGMNITAEIKTGSRRIIEYLLSPVQRAGRESLRER